MKNQCRQYWPLEEEDKKNIEQNGVYVFDTNVLLNLYRYTKKSRDNLLNIISHKKNIWLPNRVIEEYGKNRNEILIKQFNKIQSLNKEYKSLKDSITNLIRLERDNELFKKLDEAFNELVKNIEDNQIKYNDDYLLKQIFKIFENKAGSPYDTKTLDEISCKAKERFENKIPPGYKDAGKSGNNYENIGDLIVWYQIMDYSKNEDKDIIFVTDDNKEDWFLKVDGKIVSPRYELLKEFYEKTNKKIIIQTLNKFLEDDQTILHETDKNKLITEYKDILGKPLKLSIDLSNTYSEWYSIFAENFSEYLKNANELYVSGLNKIFTKKNQDDKTNEIVDSQINVDNIEEKNNE